MTGQVIPEDAREAAADVFERLVGVRATIVVEMILEAAAPHMLAEAKAEVLEEEARGLSWLGAQGNTVEPNTAWAGVSACIKILRDRAAAYRG